MDREESIKQIGAAVIQAAIDDLKSTKMTRMAIHNRQSAYYFFRSNSKGFIYWCNIAGAEPDIILERIKKEYADDFKRVFNEIQSDRQANKAIAGES
jgi:hypothetical protein